MTERLLELQSVDTAAVQLEHRRNNLPELAAARSARSELLTWEQQRTAMRERLDELDREIERDERESHEIDIKVTKLEGQLRTVIAPREAEALQHEIATLRQRRGEFDDRELSALEEQAELDDSLSELLRTEAALRETVRAAEEVLEAAEGDIAREQAELDERRAALRADLDDALLRQYDHLRAQYGVAVAKLVGHRCEGCHLDLSPAELDTVKQVPDGELADCPQCNRLLIR